MTSITTNKLKTQFTNLANNVAVRERLQHNE